MRAVTLDGRLVGSLASFVVSQALGLLLDLAPVRPLYALAASDNLGSLKVLRKAGFRIIGTEISHANARDAEIEETVLRLG
jgi:RimJ/RimL family protein N-acetyltransferase